MGKAPNENRKHFTDEEKPVRIGFGIEKLLKCKFCISIMIAFVNWVITAIRIEIKNLKLSIIEFFN